MARFLAEDKRPFIKLGSLYPKSPYIVKKINQSLAAHITAYRIYFLTSLHPELFTKVNL